MVWLLVAACVGLGVVSYRCARARIRIALADCGWALAYASSAGAVTWFIGDLSQGWPHDAVALMELLDPARWGIGSLGIVAGLFLAARVRPSLRAALVVSAPGLFCGLAIARLGCFSGGCDFGSVSTEPWVVACDPSAAAMHASWGLHPFALYSATWALVIGLMSWRAPDPRQGVALVLVWLAGAFVLEFFRHPMNLPPLVGSLNVAQLLQMIVALPLVNFVRSARAPARITR